MEVLLRSHGVAVEARRLAKLFGAVPALLRADLTVPAGTVCAVLGANGAGKTTLLRVLASALRPSAGTGMIYGRDLAIERAAVRALVDLLPTAGGAYPELSALENLRFAARMRGIAARDGVLADALGRVGLSRVADERLRTFSTGMVRRVGLARFHVTRPRLALLDEPYAGLDDDGRGLVDELLSDIRAEGRAAVFATHERDRAAAVADQVVLLDRGVVLAAADSELVEA